MWTVRNGTVQLTPQGSNTTFIGAGIPDRVAGLLSSDIEETSGDRDVAGLG
jgi:hypothetical protein